MQASALVGLLMDDYGTDLAKLLLQPGERILYKSRHGRLSKFSSLKFIPKAKVIATNKRFLVMHALPIFKNYTAISYGDVSSVKVRKSPFGSKLIVGTGRGGDQAIVFGKAVNALAAYAVLSNQISGNETRGSAGLLKVGNGTVQKSRGVAHGASLAEETGRMLMSGVAITTNLAGFIRKEISQGEPLGRTLTIELPGMLFDALAKCKSGAKVLRGRSMLFFEVYANAFKMYVSTRARRKSPGNAGSVRIGREAYMPMRAVNPRPALNRPASFDPEKELKIFKVRRLRKQHEKNIIRDYLNKKLPSGFNWH